MRQLFSAILLSLLLVSTAFGQTWTYTTSTGSQPDVSGIRVGGVLVMDKPQEDALSAWQSLPFSFSFAGEEVTGYYISDNGYITFDASATQSYAQNESDPLRNAICGWWDDLHLQEGTPIWSNQVYSKTTGSAPDRRHVIMWASAVPGNGTWEVSNVSFAIVLYERGDFEVVLVAGKTPRPLSGSIGAISADGSAEAWVEGSPRLDYPNISSSPDDDVRYAFSWTNAALDLVLLSLDIPPAVRVGEAVSIGGTVTNAGSTEVTSCRLRYSIDGTVPQVMEATDLGLTSSGTWEFRHAIAWTPAVAGQLHSITVTVDSINGGVEDEVPSNNSLSTDVVVQRGTGSEKRVLVEEFTGAWCGWCPDGGLQVEELLAQYPAAVAVALHAGGTDAMKTATSLELADTYRPSYPNAMIDRVLFERETAVPIQRTGGAWLARAAERLQAFTPCAVSVDAQWDHWTQQGFADVTVQFSDYAPEDDYRLHCWVVADELTGQGTGWDQSNYYSGHANYPDHPYHDLPNPIIGYRHRHVQYASLTGDWGIKGVVPNLPQADAEYTRRFNFDGMSMPYGDGVPLACRIVAFVTRHHGAVNEREVLNVSESGMRVLSTEVLHAANFAIDGIYPQPLRDAGTLRLRTDRAAHLRVTVTDLLGREFLLHAGFTGSGTHHLPLVFEGLHSGSYLLRVSDGSRMLARPVIIMQ
ncbi:hypothetical protein KQI65_02145 [bacterium]|nr:hypothetical protein [bacterium]